MLQRAFTEVVGERQQMSPHILIKEIKMNDVDRVDVAIVVVTPSLQAPMPRNPDPRKQFALVIVSAWPDGDHWRVNDSESNRKMKIKIDRRTSRMLKK